MPTEWDATIAQSTIDEDFDFISLLCTLLEYVDAIIRPIKCTRLKFSTAGRKLSWCIFLFDQLRKLCRNRASTILRKSQMVADRVSVNVDVVFK